MPTPDEKQPEKKQVSIPSPAEEADKWVNVAKKAADELSNNKGNRVIIFILAILVGYFAWDKFISGKDNAGNNLHQQNRGDTAQAQVVQVLKQQVEDLREDLRTEKNENKEIRLANDSLNKQVHKLESANSQSLSKIDRALNMYEMEKNKNRKK